MTRIRRCLAVLCLFVPWLLACEERPAAPPEDSAVTESIYGVQLHVHGSITTGVLTDKFLKDLPYDEPATSEVQEPQPAGAD